VSAPSADIRSNGRDVPTTMRPRLIILTASLASGAEFTPVDKGIRIKAGSLGDFELTLSDVDSQPQSFRWHRSAFFEQIGMI
jgi:hypothetical protein